MERPQENRRSDVRALERLKAKRHRRKVIRITALVLVLAGAIAYATGFFSASLAVLGDVVDSAALMLSPGKGYPAQLSVSGFAQAKAVGSGAALLGDNDLVIWSSSAKEALRIQHGYANPVLTSGNARACVYNRAGTELRVVSRTRELFTKNFDNTILLARMSPGGALAVATKSERYMAQVTVYNTSFEPVYTWYSASYYPTAIAFASDNHRLAVVCPKGVGGQLGSVITLLDTRKDDKVAVIEAPGSLALEMKYLSGGELLVVYDNMAAVYNSETGEEKARYAYGDRTLLFASCEKGKNVALLFGDRNQVSLNRVVVLNNTMQEICAVDYRRAAEDLLLTRDRVYILGENAADIYDLKGELVETVPLTGRGDQLIYCKKVLAVTSREVAVVS